MNQKIPNNDPRRQTLWLAVAVLALGWLVCWAGYALAKHSKWTGARISQYAGSLNLAGLSAAERDKALRQLVAKLDLLSPEERGGWHFPNELFRQMTDEEKSWFLDAVMPAQMKHALNYFEQLPKSQRDEAIDEGLRSLKEHTALGDNGGDTNSQPFLSPELEAKVKTLGLKTLYSSSSGQTKAELTPLLVEVQKQMEAGQIGPINGF
jgi:hypothetical protein